MTLTRLIMVEKEGKQGNMTSEGNVLEREYAYFKNICIKIICI